MPPFAQNFGWYARLMIALAAIAYSENMSAIPAQVEPLGMSVAWGPVELRDDLGVSYSRAYIARNDTSGMYVVVIRGTNPVSWETWTRQDFDIGTTVPFNTLPCPDTVPCLSGAPSTALISQGTFNGMNDLLSLRDSTGRTIVQFLQAAPPGSLYITGHSLGGTLTPPLLAYLNEVLDGWEGQQMAPFSFAGLTPGDAGFNAYFNTMVDSGVPWRFHNTLDVAPFLWWSLSSIQYIYGEHDLGWGTLEADWLTRRFREADGIGYAQPPGGDYALTGVFQHGGFLDDDAYDWTDQAMYQHHSGTYQTLVNAAFPDTTPTSASFRAIRPPAARPARR